MALEGSISINELTIAEVDADPSTGGGIDLPVGSVALLGDDISGKLWVKMGQSSTDWVSLTAINPSLTGEPTGFANRVDSSLSFNNSTRTFTISPTGPYFDIYIQGDRIRIDSSLSVSIPDVEGLYFFYIDSNGSLQYQTTFDNSLLKDKAYISFIYWSVAQAKALGVAEKRHGLTMDWATNSYLYNNIGALTKKTDFEIGDFILDGDGSLNTHAQVSIANGVLISQDINISIEHAASPSSPFQQNLTPIAQIEVAYRVGASGNWQTDAATNFPVRTGTRVQFNEFSLGTWSTTDAADGNFVAMWIVATNFQTNPIKAIMGQRQDTTLDDAKTNNIFSDLSFGAFSNKEIKLLYRLIFQTSSSYSNAPRATLVDIQDYRQGSDIDNSSSILSFSDHGQLSGRSDDDHLQYFLLGGRANEQIAFGGLNANGSLRLRSTANSSKGSVRLVDDGGRVGVGVGFVTDTPSSLLHLDSGNATSSAIKFTAGATTGRAVVDGFDLGIDAGGNAEIRQRESLNLLFFTNNTERLRINSSGLAIFAKGLRIGDETDAANGNVRYTGADFEGRHSGAWRSLTGAYISYSVSASNIISTTSGSDVLMTGMTVTPAAGTYIIAWSVSATATSNSRNIYVSVYVDGTQVTDSEKRAFIRTGAGSGFSSSTTDISLLSGTNKITVNGSQTVELRWRRDGGTAQAQARDMTLVFVGS